jgi:uncharacterized protein
LQLKIFSLKKIGLLSDTHGWLDDAVFRHFEQCDEIWHAGDIGTTAVLDQLKAFKPLKAVYGNIDGAEIRLDCPEHLRWNCEGVDVWITHIGGRPGNYALPIKNVIRSNPPKLFVCGHSHICLVKMDTTLKCLHINPGAAGRHGFHKVRTLLRFEIDNGRMQNMDVIELGPRVSRSED